MINTNMSNTTEDVSAIDITSNGTVVIPSFEEAQRSATQSANVISTNILDSSPVIEQPVNIIQPVETPQQVIEQPVQVPTQPVSPVAPAPVEPVAAAPVNIAPPMINVPEPARVDAIPNVQPATQVQAVQEVQPQVQAPQQVETKVNEVPELPQILPDVPMASDTPNMKIPEFDPNAGLPPVQMPTGVSAGEDSSAVGSTISGLPQ